MDQRPCARGDIVFGDDHEVDAALFEKPPIGDEQIRRAKRIAEKAQCVAPPRRGSAQRQLAHLAHGLAVGGDALGAGAREAFENLLRRRSAVMHEVKL